jgi:hypothetical protein
MEAVEALAIVSGLFLPNPRYGSKLQFDVQ